MRKSLSLLPLLLGSLGLGVAPFVPLTTAHPFDRGGGAPKRQPRVTGVSVREGWVLARFHTQPVPPARPTRQSERLAGRQAVKAARRKDGQHASLGKSRWRGNNNGKRPHDWSGQGWR